MRLVHTSGTQSCVVMMMVMVLEWKCDSLANPVMAHFHKAKLAGESGKRIQKADQWTDAVPQIGLITKQFV